VHAVAEQPQLASVFVFSQPFAALLSQSWVPAPHATHEPDEQVCVVVHAEVAQVVPQLASVLIAFSQPLAALVSQSMLPAAQAAHAPVVVLQVWLVVQAVARQPQLASVFVFSQALAALPSQSSTPAAQVTHAWAEQVWLVEHADVAHVVPQLASVLVAFSQPFAKLPSQSSVLAPHATQAPPVQVWLGVLQAADVQPQFASVFVFSQPSAAPLQSEKPALQTTEHAPVPEAQLAVPFAPLHAPAQQNPAHRPPVH